MKLIFSDWFRHVRYKHILQHRAFVVRRKCLQMFEKLWCYADPIFFLCVLVSFIIFVNVYTESSEREPPHFVFSSPFFSSSPLSSNILGYPHHHPFIHIQLFQNNTILESEEGNDPIILNAPNFLNISHSFLVSHCSNTGFCCLSISQINFFNIYPWSLRKTIYQKKILFKRFFFGVRGPAFIGRSI